MLNLRLRTVTACVLLLFLIGFGFVVYESSPNIKRKDRDYRTLKVVTGDRYNDGLEKYENENEPENEDSTNIDDLKAYVRERVAEVARPSFTNSTHIKNYARISEEDFQLNTEFLNFSQAIRNYEKRYGNKTRDKFRDFIIITTVDSKFIKLMENWRESLKRLGLQYNIALICEDDLAHRYYSKRQTPHFKVLNNEEYEFTGKLERKKGTYQQLIKRRTVYVRNLLFSGTDVLLVDIDAVWLKDPIDIIRQSYQIYDVWVAEGHEPRVPCPCFLYMKAVPSVMKLAGQWVNRLSDTSIQTRQFESDQFALQHVLKWRKDLRLCSLDKVRFPTGKEFFDLEWNRDNIDYVHIAHGNHLGRKIGKVDKFKEFGLWLLDS